MEWEIFNEEIMLELHGILIDSLELHSFWSELTIDEVRTIVNHSHLSFVEISINDVLWGDKFLINGE